MARLQPARSFKVLSALLCYPTAEAQAAAEEMRQVLRDERLVQGVELSGLELLVEEFRTRDLYELQERYTLLFDRSRSLSLHLFEHVHGENRDRGQAMVDLAGYYESHGFLARQKELPDYLPLFLEFLSVIPADRALEVLRDPLEIVAVLEQRLRRRKSPYAAVFHALCTLARGKVDPARLAELAGSPDPEADDLAALDRDWEEAAVSFGPEAGGEACGPGRLITRLRAFTRNPAANRNA